MGIELAYVLYIGIVLAAFGISYQYGLFMVRKTGLFFPHVFTASTMFIALVAFCMIGWFYYAWGVNEFLFFSGLMLGFALLLIGIASLLTVFSIKRKRWTELFNEGA